MGGNYSKMFFNSVDEDEKELQTNIMYQPPSRNKDFLNQPNTNTNVNTNTKQFMIPLDSKNDINVIQISPKFTTLKVILIVHDYSSDVFSIYKYLENLTSQLGVMTCSFDYPQYGWSSDGPLNKETCLQSLERVINYYLNQYYKITIVSISFASDIVIKYVSRKWKEPIALISPEYSNCNVKAIKQIMCKVKLFHGVDDPIIPIQESKKFSKKLENENKLIKPTWISNCGHFDILQKIAPNDYLDVIN